MKLSENFFGLSRKKQRGVGLLEILVALAVSAIMLLAITNIYGKFVESSAQQKEQSLVQDQANFAFLTLKRAVRMAGAGLCVRPTMKSRTYLHQRQAFSDFPNLLQKNNLTMFNSSSRLHSFHNPSAADLGVSVTPVKDSDALLVIYSDSATRRITKVVDSSGGIVSPQAASIYNNRQMAEDRKNKDDIVFYDNNGALQTTWVMMSDCEHTAIFRYTPEEIKAGGAALNILPAPKQGGFLYNFSGNGQESLISRLHARLFFVAKDADGISNLYVKNLLAPNTDAQPLASYVEKMVIQYLDPTTHTWQATAAHNNWNDEWPVKITLEMYAGKKAGSNEDDWLTYSRILDIRN